MDDLSSYEDGVIPHDLEYAENYPSEDSEEYSDFSSEYDDDSSEQPDKPDKPRTGNAKKAPYNSPKPKVRGKVKGGTTNTSSRWEFAIKERGDFSDYGIVSKISDGKFGDIYKVRNHASGRVYALKCLKKAHLIKNKMQDQAKQEIENHYIFRHPNITELFGFFQDSDRLYLVMEYCPGGTLYKTLKRSKRLSEKKAATYIYQVATALKHIHSRNVIHRDVKLENIILDANGVCKLSDFGWSTVLDYPSDRRTTMCGTLDYLSLEMIEGGSYSYDTDVWSLGVLMYELLKGSPPFESNTHKETYAKIEDIRYTVPSYFSDEAEDLLEQMLIEREDRITIKGVLRHPWILKNADTR